MTHPQPALAPALRQFSRALGFTAAALGGLVLAGWVGRVEGLVRLLPGFVPMRPNTALCLLLVGLAVALRAPRGARGLARQSARALAAVVVVLAGASLIEQVFRAELGVDQLLFLVPAVGGDAHPGRMPAFVAAALVLLGLATLGLDAERPSGSRPAQALALLAGLVPLQALVSYAYGAQAQRGASPFTQVAPHAGVGLAALVAAVLLARPEHGFMRLLASAGPGGTVARRLLLPVVLLPIGLGWMFLVGGLRLGQYEALVGASFVVVSAIVTGVAVVWRNAREVHRADEERGRVEDLLRAEREWLRGLQAERQTLLEREQVARAEAERASRAKDEFIATLSHELRTPLNSVLGWARLLRSGRLDDAGLKQAVEAIERGATTQAQIVDDLLDVSRIVRGQLRLDVRPVDLRPVIEAAVDTVRPAAQAREIAIEVAVPARACPVSGDAGRLQQIAWNLLANAIKFTPPGGRVQVTLEALPDAVQLAVTDDGQGIPSEFLPHLFERFRQLDSSTTRAHGGLGLGLAIVRHLVEAHGGTVAGDSPGPGKGSTFRVRLPPVQARPRLRTGEYPAVVAPPLRAEPDIPSLASLRVLVVDDDPDTREALKQLLEASGARVTAAGSADEALEALQRAPPDVLVSDIGMPGKDGYDLIRLVRALSPERGGRVPAAALTAYAQAEHRRAALVAGYQLYLPKPIEPAVLADAVARLAGRA
jgi:signal transduction histidine kinase/CheY-like chemotaxis protein